jgi:hypothetical protein
MLRPSRVLKRVLGVFSQNAGYGRGAAVAPQRRIVDVILSFTNHQTDVVEKYFIRIDVTEEFSFLVTKISPYYDR